MKSYKIGEKFNKLTIVASITMITKSGRKISGIKCVCECGGECNTTITDIRSGVRKSCGCLKAEACVKHNMSKTPVYRRWQKMKYRSKNKNDKRSKDYVLRGITCCKRWEDFISFYEDMGDPPTEKHSLDRIDNNKGYYKENCKWSTPKEQMNNTRTNVFLRYKGKIKTVTQWAEELNINKEALRARIKRGWEIKTALEKPVHSN